MILHFAKLDYRLNPLNVSLGLKSSFYGKSRPPWAALPFAPVNPNHILHSDLVALCSICLVFDLFAAHESC